MDKKKVLFIASRFHTNQFFLTKNLIIKNVDVHFLSVYIGASENHTYLRPLISRPSKIIRWFFRNKDASRQADRTTLRKYHITSFAQCHHLYKTLRPDIVIIRNLRSLVSLQHLFIGLLLRRKIYLYTQNFYRGKIGKARNIFFRILKLLNIEHFTPVYGNPTEPKIPNTYYIPFVIDKMAHKDNVVAKINTPGVQIVTIGKMFERKNIKELVNSLRTIDFFRAKHNRLIVVSECNTEKNRTYLDAIKNTIPAGHKSQIRFLLNIGHDRVFEALKVSDLFVLPSHKEPAAFSILEAMACGLAVICSDKNGTKCYIENGANGYVFKYSKNFGDLEVVLSKILHKNTLVNFGLRSLELVERYHGIDGFYNKIIK